MPLELRTNVIKKVANHPLPFLILTLVFVIPFIIINIIGSEKILGEKTQTNPSPASSINAFVTITPKPTASPTPSPEIMLSKSTYSIALYGDSMIDTIGDMKYLNEALKKKYPKTTFNLYNYGIGAQNVKQGFERLNLNFSYQDRSYDAITKIKADVIILGTFAYNPFDPHSISTYKNYLIPLLTQLKATGSQVYLLLEVAPLGENFGKGPQGINWPQDLTIKQSQHIEEQLLVAKSTAQSLNIPVIDVYSKTKGKSTYTSKDDGIHPSYDGHIFTANLIAQTIALK